MKKLLFPTDFSSHSKYSFKEAISLNQFFNYEIIVLHAYSRPYPEKHKGYTQADQLRELEKSIDKDFGQLEAENPALKEFEYRFVKKLGYSTDTIREQVKLEDLDLIIMGTKGASGLGEVWGTKTAKIVKSVDLPVIVLPEGTKLSTTHRIALACDFSEHTEHLKLDFLIKLAESKNLEIDIVTLNRQEKTMTNEELENRGNVLKQLEDFKPKVAITHHEDVKEGLIAYCKTNDIGLIGLLPKSYNFIERVFHDSLTEQMAFRSPIPLLILK